MEFLLHQLRVFKDERPPSTTMVCPVIQEFAGSNNHTTADAMSSGDPILPRGCIETEAFRAFSLFVMVLVKPVLTKPGATQFTLIFFDA